MALRRWLLREFKADPHHSAFLMEELAAFWGLNHLDVEEEIRRWIC